MLLPDTTRTVLLEACKSTITKLTDSVSDTPAWAWDSLTEDDMRTHLGAFHVARGLHVRTPSSAAGKRDVAAPRAVDVRIAGLCEIEMKFSRPSRLVSIPDLLDDFHWFREAPSKRVMIVFWTARTSFVSKTRRPKPTNCVTLLRSNYTRPYLQDDARPLASYLEQGRPSGKRWCLRPREIVDGTSQAVEDDAAAYRVDFVGATGDPLWAAVYTVSEAPGEQAFVIKGDSPIAEVAM